VSKADSAKEALEQWDSIVLDLGTSLPSLRHFLLSRLNSHVKCTTHHVLLSSENALDILTEYLYYNCWLWPALRGEKSPVPWPRVYSALTNDSEVNTSHSQACPLLVSTEAGRSLEMSCLCGQWQHVHQTPRVVVVTSTNSIL